MVQENPNSVTPSGVIPNDPNPDGGKGIPFSLVTEAIGESTQAQRNFARNDALDFDRGDISAPIEFNPVYYPDRYSDTLSKEVNKDSRQCGGEDVTLDSTGNPEFHATGVVLDGNVSDFRKIRNHQGPVNLITPLTDNEGGMEVLITKGTIGELVGWDGLYKQWQFSYTLDMVATGSDTERNGESQIVSEVLEEYQRETSDFDTPQGL